MSDDPNLPAIATAEVAKVWAGQIGRYFDSLFGSASREFGDYLALDVRKWRAMKLIKHAEWLEKVMKDRGLSPDQVRHLGYAEVVPLIEAASYEESDEVHELWAKLLASALDPNSGVKIEKAFVGIIREMGPAEAKLLSLVAEHGGTGQLQFGSENELKALSEKLDSEWRTFSPEVRSSAVQNLRRLGCVAPHVDPPELYGLLERLPTEWGERGVAAVNVRQFERFMEWLSGQFGAQSGINSVALPRVQYRLAMGAPRDADIAELLLVLTPLGRRLMDAIENRPENSEAAPTEAP